MKKLLVVVDVGYDSIRIKVNDEKYVFPNYICKLEDDRDRRGKIEYNEINSFRIPKYIMGYDAKAIVYYQKIAKKQNYIDYLNEDESWCLLRGAIVYALASFSKNNHIGFNINTAAKWEIKIAIMLPNYICCGYSTENMIKYILSNEKDIAMIIDKELIDIKLNIKKENIYIINQTNASATNLRINGDKMVFNDSVLRRLPAVIINLNFTTIEVARCVTNNDKTIDERLCIDNCICNTDFSIIEILKKTAVKINDMVKANYDVDLERFEPLSFDELAYIMQFDTCFCFDEVKEEGAPFGKQKRIYNAEIKKIFNETLSENANNFVESVFKNYVVGDEVTVLISDYTYHNYAPIINKVIMNSYPRMNVFLADDGVFNYVNMGNRILKKYNKLENNSSEYPFDSMDGFNFEKYCAKLLKLDGFRIIEITKEIGDDGLDIIAKKDDITYGFQCKCWANKIGNKAIQEVYTGIKMRNLDIGVVLTNNYFTKSAIKAANETKIKLWDRDKLLELAGY